MPQSTAITPKESDRSRILNLIEYDTNGGCWLWIGGTTKGYGTFKLSSPRRSAYAHRVSYTLFVGPIPDGLDIDHLCRNPLCVNPAHLEPVTTKENLHRSPHFGIHKTHCPRGHEYTQKNTRIYKGLRHCRTCALEKTKEAYAAMSPQKRTAYIAAQCERRRIRKAKAAVRL